MKHIILAITFVASFASAQNAQPGATPAGATTTAAKPFGPGDTRFAKTTAEVMHFQLKLAGRWNGIKELEPEFSKWLQPRNAKLTEIWTPFATMCVDKGVKNLPTDISKKEAAELAKNPNAKQEGFRLAHLETLAKSSKKGHKDMENAAKGIQNPELKAWADNALTVLKSTADDYEARFQEEKKRK
jgi:hypothetical protein